MTPFELVYGRQPTTMFDAMLPHVEDDDLNTDSKDTYSGRRRPASSLVYVPRTSSWWMPDTTTSDAEYHCDDLVWTPFDDVDQA